MHKILKFAYWLSIPIFMACLLYVYAMLPEKIGIYFEQDGSISLEIKKSTLFYVAIGVFIIVNYLIKIYQNMTQKNLHIDASDMDDITDDAVIFHWMTGLALFLNVTITLLLLFVGIYHSRDIDVNQYLFLLYIGPLFLLGWFFYLLFLKLPKK